jgi:post-segregation antitoxin (ccd killing protein)
MEHDYLFLAIKSLKPDAEFTYSAQDYSTIQWDVLDGDAPTQAAIDAEITKIKADEIKNAAAKIAARAALLDRLGITADEAALLLG